MPVKRALVECAVLSLQDSCVFYPCCKRCFSRLDIDSGGTPRFACFKCGYSCVKSLVDYRYRLSMQVARGNCVFGVTVFGTSLNPFFGIHANGLQRFMSDLNGPLESFSKSTLLMKAVEDCFIGKHFIFGIKITERDSEPWVGRTNGPCSNDKVQLIATQMILPKAAGLGGCTVLNYYQTILRKATEYEQLTTDPCKTLKLPGKPLLLIPHDSLTSGFTNEALCSSDFLSLSLLRSQHQDSSLSPNPLWQQTLGLITSSAEQDESRNADYRSPTFPEKHDKTTTPFNPWLGLSLSVHKRVGQEASKAKEFTALDITNSFFTSPIAAEDFPLSESLTQFLTEKNNTGSQPQESDFSVGFTTGSRSNSLLEASHRAAMNKESERQTDVKHEDFVICVHGSQAGEFRVHGCNKKEAKATCESFEFTEEDKHEDSLYNCSADLFSSSVKIGTTGLDDTRAESVSISLSACKRHRSLEPHCKQFTAEEGSLLSKQKYLSKKTVQKLSTPVHQKQDKHSLRESFPLRTKDNLHSLVFIPPSQSTPIEKIAAQKGNCAHSNLLTKQVRASVMEKSANQKNNYCVTPKSRYKKSDLLTQKHLRVRRGVLNSRPGINKCSSSVCDDKDSELIPSTPTNLSRISILKNHKSNHSLGHTVTSQKDHVQAEYKCLSGDRKVTECEHVTVFGTLLKEGNNAVRNEEWDWSRDLFSDSVG